jgi:hypothetical protein
MDWAESDSGQVTMNLQFAHDRKPTDAIRITGDDGTEVFVYDPAADDAVGEDARRYSGAIISCPAFKQGDTYFVYAGGEQMMYTGTDVTPHPGGKPDGVPPEGFGGQVPADADRKPPEGFDGPPPEGETLGQPGDRPEGPPPDGFGGGKDPAEGRSAFFMQDKVNFFSGLSAAE